MPQRTRWTRRFASGVALSTLLTLLSLGPIAPARAADGAAVYGELCAKCHGDDGRADTTVGRAMKAPAIAGKQVSGADLAGMIRESPKHKSVASKVSDPDFEAIAVYIASL
jgi:cytochrome c6